MRTLRKISTQNRPHYFINDMTSIKIFDSNLLGIDKTSIKRNDVVMYHVEYATKESLNNENIESANSVYLVFNNVDGYIECNSTKECNEYKYLIFASTDKNKEVLKSVQNFRMKLKIKLR